MLRVAVAVLLMVSAVAEADQCPSPTGADAGSIAASSARVRLAFLATTLRHEARKDALWHGLWSAGYLGLALGQGIISPFIAAEERVDWYVGLGASLVGLLFSAVNSLDVVNEGEPFALAAETVSDDGVCALVIAGERLLVADAARQTAQRSWVVHVLTGGFNVGVGLLLGLGFGHWRAALTDFLAGEAIGTANTLTRPNALNGAWARYRGAGSSPASVQLTLAPLVLRDGAGVALVAAF